MKTLRTFKCQKMVTLLDFSVLGREWHDTSPLPQKPSYMTDSHAFETSLMWSISCCCFIYIPRTMEICTIA
jgi:hypothetical protein